MEDGGLRYFDRHGCEYLDYMDFNHHKQERNKRRMESLGLGQGMGQKHPRKKQKKTVKSTMSRTQKKAPKRSQPRRSQVRRLCASLG